MPLTFPAVLTSFSAPVDRWDELFVTVSAWRSTVTEFPGCQSVYLYASVIDTVVDGEIIVNWDTAPERDAWLEKGYTASSLFGDLKPPINSATTSVERIF
jgi:hypothetical protein